MRGDRPLVEGDVVRISNSAPQHQGQLLTVTGVRDWGVVGVVAYFVRGRLVVRTRHRVPNHHINRIAQPGAATNTRRSQRWQAATST